MKELKLLILEYINLVKSNDYHCMCDCRHCKKVDELGNKIRLILKSE
jgi:hypothetical protein